MNNKLLDFRVQILLLALMSGIFLYGKLGTTDLPPLGSAAHSAISREILIRGDWLTLHWPGCEPFKDFYQFPPLFFWINAVIMKVLGISKLTAMLASATFGLGCILLTVWLGSLLFGRWAGYFGGFMMATTPLLLQQSRSCELESILVFFITLAMIFFIIAERSGQNSSRRAVFFVLFGVSTGLAFLSKGPPGYAPFAIVLIYIFAAKQRQLLKEKWLWAGVALGILLPFTWIIPQFIYEGDKFYQKYVLNQVLWSVKGRGAQVDQVRRVLDYFYFFPAVLIYYLPWSIAGYIVFFKKVLKGREPFPNEIKLLFVWVSVIWVAFSIPGYKDNYYLLPVWPAWAAGVAYFLQSWSENNSNKLKIVKANLALLVIFAVLLAFTPLKLDKPRNPEFETMGEEIRKEVPPAGSIYIYRLYYWDMAALFAWYVQRSVIFDTIKNTSDLNSIITVLPEQEKYFFLNKDDYNSFPDSIKAGTKVLCEKGRFMLFSTGKRKYSDYGQKKDTNHKTQLPG